MAISRLKYSVNQNSGPKGILFRIVIAAVIILMQTPATGQIDGSLHFKRIGSNDGLSQNYIFCMLQDHRGLMWIGTKDGLNCYDGYRFTVYRNKAFNASSLSDNYITCLYEDEKNNLWVGTRSGDIDLFNRRKNSFIRISYPPVAARKYKSAVTAMTTGPDHRLWVGNDRGEIFQLDISASQADSLLKSSGTDFCEVGKGPGFGGYGRINAFYKSRDTLWVGSAEGLFLIRLGADSSILNLPAPVRIPCGWKSSFNFYADKFPSPEHCYIRAVVADSSGDVWIASDSVLYCYRGRLRQYDAFKPVRNWKVHSLIRSLAIRPVAGGKPQVWIGMSSGLAILDQEDSSFYFYDAARLHRKGKSYGETISAFCDRGGVIWLGSDGYGINLFAGENRLFNLPDGMLDEDPDVSLRNLSIRSFYEIPARPNLKKAGLWIGTQDKLYRLNKATGSVETISCRDGIHSVEGGVYTMVSDTADNLWIGYQHGLMRYNLLSGKATYFDPYNEKYHFADQRVMKIFIDHHGEKWILTDYCLARFQPRTGKFVHYWYRQIKDVFQQLDTYPVIYEDERQIFWIGTSIGLFCFDPEKEKFIAHYQSNDQDPRSISSDWITCIVPDPVRPRRYLWLATAGGGLDRFDIQAEKTIHFTTKDGLANNNIYGILTDSTGRLWMSTNRGISCFDPRKKIFVNYDVSNNLQNNEFNFGAFYKSRSGEMFFGGITGFNRFYARDIHESRYAAPLLITGFELQGKSVKERKFIPADIRAEGTVTLPYDQSTFTITLSALDYAAPEQNKYAYRLKNKSDAWTALGTNRSITFTNLAPGKYFFEAKASNSMGYWNDHPVQLIIRVSPPWWKTFWAYAGYIVLLVAAVIFFRKREIRRMQLENKLKMEEIQAEKLKELDHLKSRFFANISHEFRTPLTLIMGPLENLIENGNTEAFLDILPETYRNSKRLLQLINQLLDLSRLDAGKYEVNTQREDIIPFIKQIVHSFSSMAHSKDISLETDVDPRLRRTLVEETSAFYFDEDIIEKIMSNLLSNAFKFTRRGGNVLVTLSLCEQRRGCLELKVEDNGEGIPAEKIQYIFDRFYQAGHRKHKVAGSGIGLALIHELVELHGGSITVKSEVDKGTAFSCLFPLNKKINSGSAGKQTTGFIPPPEELVDNLLVEPDPAATADDRGSSQVILLVEDQQDVRKYIGAQLKKQYTILEARHGKQGLEMATMHVPDLVISDVMMPEMDGYALCKALKKDSRTNHIPVILLTARAEDKDKIDGLQTGADAYLIKPFNVQELRIRVENLIATRSKMRAKFNRKLVVKPREIAVTSREREFMDQLLAIVEAHMDDERFSVEVLASKMNLSVSQVNRKLKAMVNQTTLQFIRSVRLQRAMELLKQQAGTVAEVAYQTGFVNSWYFSKMFKTQFGCLPSEREKFPSDDVPQKPGCTDQKRI